MAPRGLRLLLASGCRGSQRRLLERPPGLVETLRQEAAWCVDLRLSYFTPGCSRLEVRASLSPPPVPWAVLQVTAAERMEGGALRAESGFVRGAVSADPQSWGPGVPFAGNPHARRV